jgi:hypothetical protein
MGRGVGIGVGGVAEGGDLRELVAAEGVEVFFELGLEHGFSFEADGFEVSV